MRRRFVPMSVEGWEGHREKVCVLDVRSVVARWWSPGGRGGQMMGFSCGRRGKEELRRRRKREREKRQVLPPKNGPKDCAIAKSLARGIHGVLAEAKR